MKKIILLLILGVSLAAIAISTETEPAENYTVHEWGTFTSVSSSDGRMMEGLYLEEEVLPSFVHEFRFNDMRSLKAMTRRPLPHMEGVNVKMETPVLYFYSDKQRTVDVNVEFKGGVINQWYPQSVEKRKTKLNLGSETVHSLSQLNFTKNYSDSINWRTTILPPNSHLSYTNKQNFETPTWINPRFTDANMLQIGSEREKFIFYRGLARFKQPLKVTAQSDQKITLINKGTEDIGFALVYEYKKGKAHVWWTGSIGANSQQSVDKAEKDVNKAIHQEFQNGLIKAGLFKKEAAAMLETWRHSYFEKEGLRVFWIVPRKFTDKILPLKLTPAPTNLERVLVGRTDVMTPEFEKSLAKDFVTNQSYSPFWRQGMTKDRFYAAWKQRAMEKIRKTKHQFSFLSKISDAELPYGDYFIQKDKNGLVKVRQIPLNTDLLSYKMVNNKIDGQVEYHFPSKESHKINKQSGYYLCDRKAVFTMKKGQLHGVCKIYDTKKKEKSLIKTIHFKEGEIL
jgi:hypothetical protein